MKTLAIGGQSNDYALVSDVFKFYSPIKPTELGGSLAEEALEAKEKQV